MPATIIAIADALTAALNAASLSVSFVAERAYVPVFDLKDLMAIKVTVVPRELTMEPLSRGSDDFTYGIDAAIQKRVDPPTSANLDPLMLLAEEIMDLFRGKPLASDPDVTCMEAANVPIYAPEHIDASKVFTSVLTFHFKKARDR